MIGDPSQMGEFVVACVDMVGRSGAKEFQIRYDEQQTPTVWVAVARYSVRSSPTAIAVRHYEAAGGMTPDDAAYRLLEAVLDGGWCRHCSGVVAVEREWRDDLARITFPDGRTSCWYVFDPELKRFRRSCE